MKADVVGGSLSEFESNVLDRAAIERLAWGLLYDVDGVVKFRVSEIVAHVWHKLLEMFGPIPVRHNNREPHGHKFP